MRASRGVIAGLALGIMLTLVPSAFAANTGVKRTNYMVGPLDVTPGQNRIAYAPIAEKPQIDGWITRIKPNLTRADGSVPSTDTVMFHHGVWVNRTRGDLFFAAGEEKTIAQLPPGFGYRHNTGDRWLLNHMIHNLTPRRMKLYITYEIDFIADTSAAAKKIRPVQPIWMDVQSGSLYPVFDVLRGSGGKDGRFTYPDDAKNPYPGGRQKNLWKADRDGVLVQTGGHVHTGGLSTDLWLKRPGARYAGPACAKAATATKRRSCRSKAPSVRGNKVQLFRSLAKYWEPAGPVSWDVGMTATPPNWRVAIKKGDTLGISTTYETRMASWYESMGIMVVYMAEGKRGKNPYASKVNVKGKVTHGPLRENRVHGGKRTNLADARKLPSGAFSSNPLAITDFTYAAGDLNLPGASKRPPVVRKGQSLTYLLSDKDSGREIWHSLTSCAAPCNRSTGIAYPIPDGKIQFDSGQLGTRTPAVGRVTWETPKDLPVGTYTYFCRIHPFMRGAFRVKN